MRACGRRRRRPRRRRPRRRFRRWRTRDAEFMRVAAIPQVSGSSPSCCIPMAYTGLLIQSGWADKYVADAPDPKVIDVRFEPCIFSRG